MSAADLYVLAGSALVIAFMVGVSALLGFRRRLALNETEARRRIEEAEPGARVAELALDARGRAALARLEDGRFVALRAVGDGVSARSFAAGSFNLAWREGMLRAQFADLGFPSLHMRIDKPPAFLNAGAGGSP